jgi:NIMA (never in mitosis gene a)-related kinase
MQAKLEDFKIKKLVGKGTYCQVYLVKHREQGNSYALKTVRLLETTSEREKENALAEVRYLASVQHPNVIAYKAAFIDEPSSCLCLVMEFANAGDLSQRIKKMRD